MYVQCILKLTNVDDFTTSLYSYPYITFSLDGRGHEE